MPTAADLERLYDTHAAALRAYGLTLTRSEADTLDLMQEVFLRLARREAALDGIRDERAFLLRLLHHAAIDQFRRRDVRERTADAAGREADRFAPVGDPDGEVFRRALERELRELPAEQAAVVHLKLWEGLTFEAIADVLGIPPNTAASRYRYGLDKLRDRLRPLYEELP